MSTAPHFNFGAASVHRLHQLCGLLCALMSISAALPLPDEQLHTWDSLINRSALVATDQDLQLYYNSHSLRVSFSPSGRIIDPFYLLVQLSTQTKLLVSLARNDCSLAVKSQSVSHCFLSAEEGAASFLSFRRPFLPLESCRVLSPHRLI